MKHLPNILTISRLFAIFAIGYFLSKNEPLYKWTALILYCFSVLTDFLDGYIARKFNAVSGLGKSLDATVDKVFFFGVLIFLMYLNIFSFWVLSLFLLIHICRDVLVTWMRYILHQKNVFVGAINAGKVKTVFQFIFLFLGMFISLCHSYPAETDFNNDRFIHTLTLSAYIIYFVSLVLGVSSGVHYMKYFLENK
ncbi:CDP-diacylglycerol--glycerol-3-phosphate 3-phosphatidyltransferase [Opitutae bacterium]|nr:CDP-diacylglycerol--glycerol-3-phosphate 3-phosphatidyltransferase [Opitutae bacterium]